MTPAVSLRGVAKSYGSVTAVRPLDLEVAKGEFLAILGPSGCGKTTLLRMIGGFAEVTAGRILVAGQDVTDLPPEARPTNMVFQGYGLFPHMTVRQNIGYGLRLRRLPKAEVAARVDAMLALVRLESQADRGVAALSGGQQQRVAVARALTMAPPVLLLDEPFSALDLKLRQAMQEEMRRIHAEVGGTFIFVTHDQTEALALATRIAVMNDGRMEQVGTPEEMYLRPATRFVAEFVGEANVLPGVRRDGQVSVAGLRLADPGPDQPVVLVLRPEHLHPGPGALSLSGQVIARTFFGTFVQVVVALADGAEVRMHAPVSDSVASPGDSVTLHWREGQHHILPADQPR